MLQVDKSRTGTQSALEFPGQQKEQEYEHQQQEQQQGDQADLQQRHAELRRILDASATDGGSELGVNDGVDSRITSIWQNMQAYSNHSRIIKVCNQWRREMADLNLRMHKSWTKFEKTSLISLLSRFEAVLLYLLPLLPAGSAYDPMARQDINHTRVVQLFVSSGNFLAFDRAGKQS